MKAGRPEGQGGADMSTMIEDMKKRRLSVEKRGGGSGEGRAATGSWEMMKAQLGEAMKKQQQQGRATMSGARLLSLMAACCLTGGPAGEFEGIIVLNETSGRGRCSSNGCSKGNAAF